MLRALAVIRRTVMGVSTSHTPVPHRWLRRPGDHSLRAVGAVALLVVVVAGCAAGDSRFTTEDPAGFFMGLWHGIISMITLVVGIFTDSVQVYERNNTGGWYDFGFLLGVSSTWGGGSTTAYHRARRRTRREIVTSV
jgi:hypothetical protein